MTDNKKEQQRTLAKKRRSEMGAGSRARASKTIVAHLLESSLYAESADIGAYLAFASEVNLSEFLARAHLDDKRLFVPIVAPGSPDMRFARINPHTPLRRNRFGIEEPDPANGEFIAPRQLQSVLLPLVAFDDTGNRLGMGAGFYDRAFAFRHKENSGTAPVLCGVAFECQRMTRVLAQPWDVPLDCVVTEAGLRRCARDGLVQRKE